MRIAFAKSDALKPDDLGAQLFKAFAHVIAHLRVFRPAWAGLRFGYDHPPGKPWRHIAQSRHKQHSLKLKPAALAHDHDIERLFAHMSVTALSFCPL